MELKLEVRNLACGYGAESILRDVSFSLAGGEILCILGPNGVGKTTLFKTILGLLRRQGGQLRVCGRTVEPGHHGTPDGMAYVPQAHFPTFSYSVLDVVVMGRTRKLRAFATPTVRDYAAAEHVLAQLGMAHLAQRDYTAISGGERQMVLIARALVQEPAVLVMDEPAASLDYGNQVKLLRRVRALAQEGGMGILMTTHNPDHAFLAATHALLILPDRGVLSGTVGEILTDASLSAAYGTEIRILEKHDRDGTLLQSCVPKL